MGDLCHVQGLPTSSHLTTSARDEAKGQKRRRETADRQKGRKKVEETHSKSLASSATKTPEGHSRSRVTLAPTASATNVHPCIWRPIRETAAR